MFDFFDNRDKCQQPGFLRVNIYTSCISMFFLDHFAKKKQHFLSLSLSLSLSRSPISSHFLLGSPLPPFPDSRIAQLLVPWLSSKKSRAPLLPLISSLTMLIVTAIWCRWSNIKTAIYTWGLGSSVRGRSWTWLEDIKRWSTRTRATP